MHQHHKRFGATITARDARVTEFRLWAPDHDLVSVCFPDRNHQVSMTKQGDGFHVAEVENCGTGQLYQFQIGDQSFPDPASRFQPDGVHGPSQVVSTAFEWTDADWKGIPKSHLVIYELHVGTFTEQGTFASAIDRLDELVELGITAIELMPVAASAGRWNWGYDGVCLFAPFAPYGTPDDFRRLVNEAHRRGLAVVLDVVYNHLGPEGNYLSQFGPYLSSRHNTIWGAAPNFDDLLHGSTVREFFIAAALIWLDEYHIDGLRVDAIHCMRDDSEPHIAVDISKAVKQWSSQTGRPAILIAETNVYDANMLVPIDAGGVGFDAEWCDDFLHSVFAVLRPGEQLCHRSYRESDLDQTLKSGYVFAGSLRKDDSRSTPTERVDTSGLIYSIQHHDFIGNHPLGKRLHQLVGFDGQAAAAGLLLLSPGIPMLFMGEEFCCENPFQFFVDFGDENLKRGVVDGRKREYPQHNWSLGVLPIDAEAFTGSKIGSASDGNREMQAWYQRLLQLRHQCLDQGLISDQNITIQTDRNRGLYALRYRQVGKVLTIVTRFALRNEKDAVPICITNLFDDLAAQKPFLDSRPIDTANHDQIELQANHAMVFLEK